MGNSVASDCSMPSSGDSLCHRDCATQKILKHCKSQTVVLDVCTEKSMSVNVNGQHESEPQRKDVRPDEHGGDDKPKSEQRLCARPVAGATAQCWARRAAADPVPFRKGGITTFLIMFLHISSCLSTASRSLKVDLQDFRGMQPADWRLATTSPIVPFTRRVGRLPSSERVTGDCLVHKLLLSSAIAAIMNGIAGCVPRVSGPYDGGVMLASQVLDGLLGLPVYPVETEGATDEARADIDDGDRVQGGLGGAPPLCAGLRESSNALLTSSLSPISPKRELIQSVVDGTGVGCAPVDAGGSASAAAAKSFTNVRVSCARKSSVCNAGST
ncbi:hypothetical protein CYMTET_18958 [Cymbomonas tetramitiformis]|uniref:Uncharacterized protein n=1 Tax=Cymbomonas tetramitiformis TaxID=36881 RepID=A0AAE0L5D3_9CHLO|nr:hypothetical protein CYMTET_18958 [Cymbomonas tetramitiformis]